MKNAAGILLVIYLFFLVPLLAGAFIDAAAGVKRRNISSTYANGFVAMLGIFWGVAVLFLYRGCTLEKLSMVWMLATITICVASILANKKAIYGCFKHKRKSENGHKTVKMAMHIYINHRLASSILPRRWKRYFHLMRCYMRSMHGFPDYIRHC